MRIFLTRRQWLLTGIIPPVAGLLAGCGTILHPERRGQPAGRIDWAIFALDAVGLLFFFLPGVVAFAVDFSNGTIYLPAYECCDTATGRRKGKFIAVDVPREELTPECVERIVAERTKRPVKLAAGAYRTRPLEEIEEYWSVRDEMEAG